MISNRFTILMNRKAMRLTTSIPYTLYDGDKYVRGLKGAKWWAQELLEGHHTVGVRE